jgi:hypothetical protein
MNGTDGLVASGLNDDLFGDPLEHVGVNPFLFSSNAIVTVELASSNTTVTVELAVVNYKGPLAQHMKIVVRGSFHHVHQLHMAIVILLLVLDSGPYM